MDCAIGDLFYFELLSVDKNLLDHPHLSLGYCTSLVQCIWLVASKYPGVNAVQGVQVACGKTSTFHLGTPVSLSWRPCSDRMWKLILLLFKMVLLMTRSLLRCCCRPEFSSCLKEEKAPFIVLHYPSSLITSTNIKLPSSTPEWGYGLLFVWFLVVNCIKMNRIVALLVLVFKTRIPQIP